MRRKTREIQVGKVGIGGDNPIRVQSMTTSNTRDVDATVDQILRLEQAGCEIVRVTVQGKKEAGACESIKNALAKRGCAIPLIADIHFYPPAALLVADFVDKIRINPGNFADRRAVFKTIEYDDATYMEELEKIEETFTPLVDKCKRLGRAMRIGTNHGSLSDRIMNRYGDTPAGMVESALEYARICHKQDYHNFLFSMKASNPKVMVETYRLLVSEMDKLGWDYPLHLGVTEAGDGEDGRIKSAIGIGSLLIDGMGDTIRVSLTEDPWEEIAPCKELVTFAEKFTGTSFPLKLGKRFVREDSSGTLHRDGSVLLEADPDVIHIHGGDPSTWKILLEQPTPYVLFSADQLLHEGRAFFRWIREAKLDLPVILKQDEPLTPISGVIELGALLLDGLGEGICIPCPEELGYKLLQACRMRATSTEYIACPGCGRTLFNLQEVTARIRSKTAHLPGVKIAIMGCIVNGPGEMADADFGYVGSRTGKVDLYVGKTCIERDIDETEADERLIALIKVYDRWIEPRHETLACSNPDVS